MRPPMKKKQLPPPRVRKEPPTLEEAVVAACDITDEPDQQVAFAAGLMGVEEDEVRPLVEQFLAEKVRSERRLMLGRAPQERMILSSSRDAGPRRVVVVERRPSRLVARARV